MNRRLRLADAGVLVIVALGFAIAVTGCWHLIDYSAFGSHYRDLLGTVIADRAFSVPSPFDYL